MIKDKRIYWVDYSRFIGVFLVILGHIPFRDVDVNNYIYSFHLPLFFIISGYLEKGVIIPLKDSIKKDAQSLLIPYVSFYIIAYLWMIIQKYIIYSSYNVFSIKDSVIRPIIGLFIGEWPITPFSIMINGPLWFLLGLFFCKLFFKYSLVISKKSSIRLILINMIAISLVYIIHRFTINLYFNLDSALMALPFYTFGYFLQKIEINASVIKILIIFALSIIVNIFLFKWNGRVDISSLLYGKNVLIFYLTGIIGSFSIFSFTLLFSNRENKLLLYLGQNTLIIFGLHGIINPIIQKYYKIYVLKESGIYLFSFTDGIIVGLIILILSSIPIYFIHKYCPFILGQYLNKKR